ncbi:MAG: alpha-mannosidase [Chloroflexi bacterium]|nr:alpha-mannosidase [Chloroflexota bacterium]
MPLVIEKITHLNQTLRTHIYRDAIPLTDWKICDHLPFGTPQPPVDDARWRDLTPGELWGARLTFAWLTHTITLPDSFAGKPAALHLELGALPEEPDARIFSPPEALVAVIGLESPPQALNLIHHEILLAEDAPAGQTLTVTLDVSAGLVHPGEHRVYFKFAELVWIDRDVEALYWDAAVLLDTIAELPDSAPERGAYVRALDAAFGAVNWLNPPDDAFRASVVEARAVLRERVFDKPALSGGVAPRPVIHALGHAHIDVAWLWPLHITRGKAIRTFATALALMDQYPEFTFTQSQPHLYQMVAEDAPELFDRIKAQIAEGRWNATGATWVEPDTNLPSGEALVRQFLYGMRYFQRELGVRPEVLWLPDVFGYCGALPQIMALAGIRYFFTSKLSWNQYNRHPYDTFWWEGLDGTRVLTHLATTPDMLSRLPGRTAYHANLLPEEMIGSWNTYRQKDANHHLATAYGLGDGGGGPNRDMLERGARQHDLPGLPQIKHSTAEAFFHAMENTIPDDLPRWVGELYFEMHRGTYTSQARTKRHNRKSEALLHSAEALASIALLLGRDYPQTELNTAWQIVLLNQFHDILPGSSIGQVYEDAERDYAQALRLASAALDDALVAIAEHIRWDADMQGFAVFNTLGTALGGPVEVSLDGDGAVEIIGPAGNPQPFQWVDEYARRALLLPDHVPAYGYVAYAVRPAEQPVAPPHLPPIAFPITATPTRLENGLLRAEFDERGQLVRLYDLEHFRDVFAPGEIGNQLWAYVDRPHHWDAWEVEVYVQDQGWRLEPEAVRLVESGPLRATLEVTYTFNRSRITQRISLLAGERTLQFETDVDWHEQHILLRAHFPLAIHAMQAAYEVQFGMVDRPTHQNTSWDVARHEVPAQNWADMSEHGYGVALLNDCKYGYSARDNVLTLSLLRAPVYPDPQADEGHHAFTYSLYPHGGDWRTGVVAQARRLNHPLLVQPLQGGGTWLPVAFGLVSCPTPGVLVDTLKKAEDDEALIVRVYEAHGGRAAASLVFATSITSAEEINLLEEPLGPVDVMRDTLRFNLTPYQIRTFRVKLADIREQELG